jgi:hypothetical protein
MRFGPVSFGIIGMLGMVSGTSGCHSSTPDYIYLTRKLMD